VFCLSFFARYTESEDMYLFIISTAASLGLGDMMMMVTKSVNTTETNKHFVSPIYSHISDYFDLYFCYFGFIA